MTKQLSQMIQLSLLCEGINYLNKLLTLASMAPGIRKILLQ